MAQHDILSMDDFRFRGLHAAIRMGTASDRYAGWIGQIYSKDRYERRITRRSHSVGGKSFVEEVLPVDSVREYFQHFPVLELDFTFYRPLLEADGGPSQNLHVLRSYHEHMGEEDRVILKVPQAICARKVQSGGGYVDNKTYLHAETFTRQFYDPAVGLLGHHLSGFIFEQEYHRKDERFPVDQMARDLDAFFREVPRDNRYHVELRTEAYLSPPVLEVLERHGVGQVISHWTWLPPLRRQLDKSGGRFLNGGGECVVRLMTPLGMRYEEAYARAHPFDQMVEGMLQPRMVEETARLMEQGIREGVVMNVIINNRAGGNAPLIARQVAQRFLDLLAEKIDEKE